MRWVATSSTRNYPAWLTALLALIGLLLIVGIVYFAETAANLPSFFPGHKSGSGHHHTKHGIHSIILAILAFAGAWMTTGKKKSNG